VPAPVKPFIYRPVAVVEWTAMEFTDVKAPEPVHGIPPWLDPRWIAEAEFWIEEACERCGRRRTGPARARARAYSVVARVPTDQGTAWFKASPPMSAFEPALLAALSRWYPENFAAPLAIDLNRAWSLARDGGQTLLERHGHDPDADAWPRALRRYGLWVAMRTAAEHAGVGPRSAQMSALTSAYFAPWREAGHPEAALDRSWHLALRIAPLARALTWGRVFPCLLGHPATAAHAARSLAALLKPGPLG
jgi:hypothetical protein